MPSANPTAGVDDLQTLYPVIAIEAEGWDPTSVKAGSSQSKQWRCPKGHAYEQTVKKRTQGKGCPYCKNKRILVGFNDLWTTNPDIAAEANGWDPLTVCAGSGKTAKWRCPEGHEYTSRISSRTGSQKSGCPICANKQVLIGFNDLATLFPEIANEADGWDPKSVTPGSNKEMNWICTHGHQWQETVNMRTPPRSYGCPYCSGKRVDKGFNDLLKVFPAIAAEADGWDPSMVSSKSGKKLKWRCQQGHTWLATVAHRTVDQTNCPYCAGRKVKKGFNDLLTVCPDIASEAYGWDPSEVSVGSNVKVRWKCKEGHTWEAAVVNRTPPRTGRCPTCIGKTVLKGFNDLATLYPEIAKQAHGWDPSTIPPKTNKSLSWKCEKDHIWNATPNARTPPRNSGCPICSNQQVLTGFNDLATLRPEIAREAYGWQPSTVTPGSRKRAKWRCESGHTWEAVISSRTSHNGSACPICAEYGFKRDKVAWFYLMQRPGEQQIGITNDNERRIRTHEKNGWILLDIRGPSDGEMVLETEKDLKKWLKENIGVIDRTTENWSTTRLEVQSLMELKKISGIKTKIF